MKLLIIRHGDPDYIIDGLTERGKLEAELLSRKLEKENIKYIYCSPLGRAKLTAEPTAKKLGLPVKICDFLREFDYPQIALPYLEKKHGLWDLLPEFVAEYPELYDKNRWREADFIKESGAGEYYDKVTSEFDKVLAEHGYARDGINYKAVNPNHDIVAFFCHYGLSSVLLSHIMNCSPYVLWQNAVVLPTAVTTVHTEERKKGIASLRVCSIGDTSHLYVGNVEPSFSARFCECFDDNTRHD